jgi:hypothetical protein
LLRRKWRKQFAAEQLLWDSLNALGEGANG